MLIELLELYTLATSGISLLIAVIMLVVVNNDRVYRKRRGLNGEVRELIMRAGWRYTILILLTSSGVVVGLSAILNDFDVFGLWALAIQPFLLFALLVHEWVSDTRILNLRRRARS